MIHRLSSACAIALLAVAPAFAQGGAALPDRPISRSEVIAAIKQQFTAMDTNHDGVVTRDEFDAYHAAQSPDADGVFGHVGGHWFDKADAGGDGRVTLAEAESARSSCSTWPIPTMTASSIAAERKTAMMMMKFSGK